MNALRRRDLDRRGFAKEVGSIQDPPLIPIPTVSGQAASDIFCRQNLIAAPLAISGIEQTKPREINSLHVNTAVGHRVVPAGVEPQANIIQVDADGREYFLA